MFKQITISKNHSYKKSIDYSKQKIISGKTKDG